MTPPEILPCSHPHPVLHPAYARCFGKPTVDVGYRQKDRMRAPYMPDVPCKSHFIVQAVCEVVGERSSPLRFGQRNAKKQGRSCAARASLLSRDAVL